MKQHEELTGRKFNSLTAEKYLVKGMWICRCDCGASIKIRASSLKSGATQSCGCKHKMKITYKGETKFIADFEREYNFPRNSLYQRIKNLNWDVTRAIETPVNSFDRKKV